MILCAVPQKKEHVSFLLKLFQCTIMHYPKLDRFSSNSILNANLLRFTSKIWYLEHKGCNSISANYNFMLRFSASLSLRYKTTHALSRSCRKISILLFMYQHLSSIFIFSSVLACFSIQLCIK